MPTTTTTIDAGTYTTDPVHSSFQASARHMGVGSFRTTFEDVEAQLTSGDQGLSLEGRAQVASISITKPPEFREHVVNGEDFFDASRHPEIAFSSTSLDLDADGTAELDGDLVIKGIAKPLHATGSWREATEDAFGGLRTALDLTAVVDRRDFGLDWQMALPKGGDALGWEITIEVQLELVKDAG